MSTRLPLVLFLTFLLFRCKNNTSVHNNLEIIPNDTLMMWAENGTFPKPKNLKIFDESGKRMSMDSYMEIEDPRSFRRDYYRDETGEIVKIVVSKATEKDKVFFDKLNKLEELQRGQIDFSTLIVKDVDCSRKRKILEDVFKKDQNNRNRGAEYIDRRIDKENIEFVSSLIETCEDQLFDGLDPIHASAIFLAIQHSEKRYRNIYKSILEKGNEKGLITDGQIALLSDRILMDRNKPQIYGTQIQDGALYKVDNLDSVEYRRSMMNMTPLQEYLAEFGISFK